MKLKKHLKETLITLLVISLTTTGYAIVATVTDGDSLTTTIWNEMKDIVNTNETKLEGVSNIGGNVGIGTTSPGAKLDVVSNSNVSAVIRSLRGEYINIGAGLTTQAPYIRSGSDNFFIGSDGYPTLYIDGMSNGNVGIGTTVPISKLDVNASITNPLSISSASPAIYFHDAEQGGTQGATDDNRYDSWMIRADGNKLFFGEKSNINSNTPNMDNVRVTLNNNGNVGIGTTSPGYRLQVGKISNYGYVSANGSWTASSDIRFKENIELLENSLDKINSLRGVKYNVIGDTENQIGFIAQEMENIIPEIVTTDSDGYKGISYSKITPVLVEAIKELKTENDQKSVEIAELKAIICLDYQDKSICQ